MNRDHRKANAYAFIDSQNLNLGIQNAGWKMDWIKFRKFLADRYGVTKAFMFIGYVPEQEEMYQKLYDSGYGVVLKPTYDMTKPRPEDVDEPENSGRQDKEDKKQIKGNIDADLVLWAMKEINNYDKAVIISGDGDFYVLIEYLHEQGKLLKILTPTWKYSSLFNRFEKYIDRLDGYKRQLAYKSKSSAK